MKKYIYFISLIMMLSTTVSCTENKSSEEIQQTSENITETGAVTETQPFSEICDGATVTFEDGFLWTAECINDFNFEDDEAECELSVEEFNGNSQLRIQVITQDDEGNYKIPKIRFDVDKLIGTENVSKIKTVSMDISAVANGTFLAENGEEILVPGNCIGEIDANSGEECAVWTTLAEFAFEEWKETSVTKHIVGNFLLPKSRYIDGEKGCTIVFMRWTIPNKADVYIDNITFYDDNGNPIPLVYDPLNPPVETEITGTDEEIITGMKNDSSADTETAEITG